MSRFTLAATALLLVAGLAGTASAENDTSLGDETWCSKENVCGLHDDDGPWMSVLQKWALSAPEHGERQGRIMALPPTQGYYVTDRIDGGTLSPPPPPHHKHPNHPLPPGGRPYDEWQYSPLQPPNTGKIVNRPPNPYKDKFKPSPAYPAQVHNQPIPVHSQSVDRVDENRQPPQKQVSETDLYLLGAIEKLVWRADLFEKRMRKLEEAVHVMVAGVQIKEEPCAENFTRVGDGCYHVSSDAVNWKGANYGCRRLKSSMLEIDSDHEKNQLASSILADKKLKGNLNTERGFILINPGEGPYTGGSRCVKGKVPKMCSLVKCIWLYKLIRITGYLTLGSIGYFFMMFVVAKRIDPNIALTDTFAKASLKFTNTIRLPAIFFPWRKMDRNQ